MSSKDLDVAIEAAQNASQIIKTFTNSENSLDIKYKARHDLVTDADVASEKKIISIIKEYFPNDVFLAEETADATSITDQRTWIIDPIDGTTNFAHGFPTYCVSIALYENLEAVAGVVLEVSRGELFTAIRGEGAYLDGQKLSVSNLEKPDEALIGTGFPYRDLGMVDEYLELFKVFMHDTQGVRRPGSAAYDLCSVAAGRFEGFYEYGLSPWDVAAGSLIIREAGGFVTDWQGTNNWLFGRRIVAGNKSIHEYIKSKIKETISLENITD